MTYLDETLRKDFVIVRKLLNIDFFYVAKSITWDYAIWWCCIT